MHYNFDQSGEYSQRPDFSADRMCSDFFSEFDIA